MLSNILEDFAEKVFEFLTGKPYTGANLLLKKHSDKIHQTGDFSFPNSVRAWQEHIKIDDTTDKEETLLNHRGIQVCDLIRESQKWKIEIENAREEHGRITLFLNRTKCVPIVLLQGVVRNNELLSQLNHHIKKVSLDISPQTDSLTALRLKCLTNTLKKLYLIHLLKNTGIEQDVILTTNSSLKPENACSVLCGVVLNAKTGTKEKKLSAEDYIRTRQAEMSLIAQHKYGLRVTTNSKWQEFTEHIGESAVVFELLQIKPTAAVKVNFACSSGGNSKGVSFVLYNCARIETILKKFHDQVSEGLYPPLPPLEEVDFKVLTQNDEWSLIFNFIMEFPAMLNSCVEITETTCRFRPDYICTFLCLMCLSVSKYYRKVRILTEPREHLLPIMFARLHMLDIFNNTLKNCLNILNIKSVPQM